MLISNQVISEALRFSGWTEERQFEIGHWVMQMEAAGFPMNQYSRDVFNSGPTNFELDSVDTNTKLPDGWGFHCCDPKQFESGVKREDDRDALWIRSESDLIPSLGEKSSMAGKFTQKFSGTKWRGQKVRFSADIKCKNVGAMYDLALGGDIDWQNFSVVLDVPPIGCNVIVCVTLNGNGEVFFSNLSFSTAAPDEAITDRKTGPKNLTFSE